MALFVSEHPSDPTFRQPATKAALVSYTLSSGAAGPFPQGGTKFIRVNTDAAMYLCLNLASTSSVLTSTNSFRLSANGPAEIFAVSTSFRIQGQTTST